MKKLTFILSFIVFSWLIPLHASVSMLEKNVHELKLANGMVFLLVPRKGAPVFTGYIRVKVGGADEKPNYSGIAHMLEHMAFKGTPRIGTRNYSAEKRVLEDIEKLGIRLAQLTRSQQGESDEAKKLKEQMKLLQAKAEAFVVKDEYARTFTENGGTEFNATTSKDLTSYFVSLPINKLELWAYLTSEALRNPVFREFYQERDVVMEERRMRVDDDPFGKNYEEFLKLAFEKSPYQDPTIGYAKDISALTATDLRNFYNTYYVPQNMVGAVVGDIDLARTEAILQRYFGSIPAGKNPPPLEVKEPEQTQARREVVEFDARPQIMIGYHKPTMPAQDDYVFDLIAQVMCEGRSSRLYKSLVQEQKIAQSVDCDTGTPGARLDNMLFIFATALGKHSPEELEKAIVAQIEKLQNQAVSAEDLTRAKNQLIAELVFKMSSNFGLAESLTYFQAAAGDWRYLVEHSDKLEKITPQEIERVARKYLVKSNQTISILKPSPKKGGQS